MIKGKSMSPWAIQILVLPSGEAANDGFLCKEEEVEALCVSFGTSPDMIRHYLAPGIMQPQKWDNTGETGPSRSPVGSKIYSAG